jgi:geranylgeranyl diphosphate synthase, type I
MDAETVSLAQFLALRERVDAVLHAFLREERGRLEREHPRAVELLDEVVDLIDAGGKRLRPAFCYLGYRAVGGEDEERALRAAAAFELLHSMALIHDDVMDGDDWRRGRPAVHARLTEVAAKMGASDPARIGRAVAILAGDVAAVLADELLLRAGFPADRFLRALGIYHRMRLDMVTGQYLDLAAAGGDARRLAFLKGGAYTVLGPLLVGATLAGASPEDEARLRAFGEPLGEAFQLRDDLHDGDAAAEVSEADVAELVARAKGALQGGGFDPWAVAGLGSLADVVGGS